MRISSTLALGGLLSLATPAVAWGAVGHEITATIAQMYLNPGVLEKICAVVTPWDPDATCHLAPLATWADRIRGLAQYKWAAPFHFITPAGQWPPSTCTFGEQGWEGTDGVNILGGIYNTSQWIQHGNHGQAEAVKFLIHFLGDMHQPLHMAGRDRGGNLDKVRFRKRIINLHSLWDSYLISNAILLTPSNYSKPLDSPQVEAALRGSIYDPYVRSIVWEGLMGAWDGELDQWYGCPAKDNEDDKDGEGGEGDEPKKKRSQVVLAKEETDVRRWDTESICPYHWARPIALINCGFIWPSVFDYPKGEEPPPHKRGEYVELDTPEYAGRVRKEKIIERLLAQGGIRMAAVLNGLFADPEETRK